MNTQSGIEIHISTISGSTTYATEPLGGSIIDPTPDKMIRGKYMAVTLGRLFVNLPMYKMYGDVLQFFTILEATWQNSWDYPMKAMSTGNIKMIDSEGFQHSGDICEYHGFQHVYKPSTNEVYGVQFPWPELTLEAYAKTRGWVWFEDLPEGTLPRRFIFNFDIFDPGQTSGWVRDKETLAFDLTKFQQVEFNPEK